VYIELCNQYADVYFQNTFTRTQSRRARCSYSFLHAVGSSHSTSWPWRVFFCSGKGTLSPVMMYVFMWLTQYWGWMHSYTFCHFKRRLLSFIVLLFMLRIRQVGITLRQWLGAVTPHPYHWGIHLLHYMPAVHMPYGTLCENRMSSSKL